MHSNLFRQWLLLTVVALVTAALQVVWAPPVFAAQSGDPLTPNSDAPLPAPKLEVLAEASGEVHLAWGAVPGAAGYNLYRSTTQGTGYKLIHYREQVEHSTGYDYIDKGLTDRTLYYYIIKTVNSAGIESITFDEVEAMPHRLIEWVGTVHIPGAGDALPNFTYILSDTLQYIDGEVNIPGYTGKPVTPPEDLEHVWAQLGYGPASEPPSTWETWVTAEYVGRTSNDAANDVYRAPFFPTEEINYGLAYRFSTSKGRYWTYGAFTTIKDPNIVPPINNVGMATVVAAVGDGIPPAMPLNFKATVFDRNVNLSWDANTEPDLYAYKIIRNNPATGEHVVYWVYKDQQSFEDKDLLSGTKYTYQLYAVDQEMLISPAAELKDDDAPTTESKPVTVTINLTVPPFTPGTVYLSRQKPDGKWEMPVAMTKNGNVWSKTLGPIEEGTYLTLYFHRNKTAMVEEEMQKTGHALANGDTPAPLTTIQVIGGTNGTMIVNRYLTNWLDPLPVRLFPSNNSSGISPYEPISITWNQPMAANNCFQVFNQGKLIPGSCSYYPDTYTTVFEPDIYLPALTTLDAKVSGQKNQKGNIQQVDINWSFKFGPYYLHLPVIRK